MKYSIKAGGTYFMLRKNPKAAKSFLKTPRPQALGAFPAHGKKTAHPKPPKYTPEPRKIPRYVLSPLSRSNLGYLGILF